MTCRFILSLKEAVDRPSQDSTIYMSAIRFNACGNPGESLDLENEPTKPRVDGTDSQDVVEESDNVDRSRHSTPDLQNPTLLQNFNLENIVEVRTLL